VHSGKIIRQKREAELKINARRFLTPLRPRAQQQALPARQRPLKSAHKISRRKPAAE
jgi:hypothetical protein